MTLLCRLLPLELIVPLLARSPLLELGIQLAYSSPVLGDRQLRRLIARPALRPTAVRSLRAMSTAMALRPWQATARALLPRLQQPLLLIWGQPTAWCHWRCRASARSCSPALSWPCCPTAATAPTTKRPILSIGCCCAG